jgi:hypothetical protein
MAITFTAELRQSDGTLIATRTLTSYAAAITETFDLTSGERDAITSWSTLELWLSHTGTDGQSVVTAAYLEYPAGNLALKIRPPGGGMSYSPGGQY